MAKAPKGSPSKAAAPKSAGGKAPAKNAAGTPAKAAAKAEQLSLDAGSPPEASAAPAPALTPVAEKAETPARKEGSPVVELVIGAEGTWKKLASGRKVPIDEKEWQLELARMLAKKVPAETPPTEN